jgi:hypothetical protein
MILMGATSLRGALEGVGPENRDFLGPDMARAKHEARGGMCYWHIMKYWYVKLYIMYQFFF